MFITCTGANFTFKVFMAMPTHLAVLVEELVND